MQPDDIREAIADAVRAEMARGRRTQRELAAVLGLDQASVSLRLRGERSFKAEELAATAGFLQVSVESLLSAEAA